MLQRWLKIVDDQQSYFFLWRANLGCFIHHKAGLKLIQDLRMPPPLCCFILTFLRSAKGGLWSLSFLLSCFKTTKDVQKNMWRVLSRYLWEGVFFFFACTLIAVNVRKWDAETWLSRTYSQQEVMRTCRNARVLFSGGWDWRVSVYVLVSEHQLETLCSQTKTHSYVVVSELVLHNIHQTFWNDVFFFSELEIRWSITLQHLFKAVAAGNWKRVSSMKLQRQWESLGFSR